MRFFSHKTRINNKISLFRALKRAAQCFSGVTVLGLTGVIVVVIVVTTTTQLVSAKRLKSFAPEKQSIHIFPSVILSRDFTNLGTLAIQDVAGSSLFQQFNIRNSAYIVPTAAPSTSPLPSSVLEVHSPDLSVSSSMQADIIAEFSTTTSMNIRENVSLISEEVSVEEVIPEENSSIPLFDEVEIIPPSEATIEVVPEIIENVRVEIQPVEIVPDPTPTPVQEVPVMPTEETQALVPSDDGLFAIFKKVTKVFRFTQAIISTPVETPAVEEVIAPVLEPVEENIVEDLVETIFTGSSENVAASEGGNEADLFLEPIILGESTSTSVIELEELVNLETLPDFPLSTSTEVDTAESVVIIESTTDLELPTQDQTTFKKKVVTFRDFGLPEFESGQFINNLQLRLSLAGQYEMNASSSPASIDINYTFGEFSGNAGSILMEGEFSNALNGGYFLMPLPSITDSELLEDLEITLIVNGEDNRLTDFYIDAAWIEVETVLYDKQLLKDRTLPSEMWKHLQELNGMDFLSGTLDFTRDEVPYFNLRYNSQRNRLTQIFRSFFGRQFAKIDNVSFIRSDGELIEISPKVTITKEGLVNIVLTDKDKEELKPGTYTVEIKINEGGMLTTDSFEFQWGLLSINPLQSEYAPSEVAEIHMGALEPSGNTLCNADLRLYVIEPDGFIGQAYVAESGECVGNNVVDVPDYSATYQIKGAGEYEMYLEHLDVDGSVLSHTSDTFLVADNQEITIERKGPTRIYPLALYTNELFVHTFEEPFSGVLTERVPSGFVISDTTADVKKFDTYTELTWNLSIGASSTQSVVYSFDAPDISPYLYEVGPARLSSDEIISIPVDPIIPITPTSTTTYNDVAIGTSTVVTRSSVEGSSSTVVVGFDTATTTSSSSSVLVTPVLQTIQQKRGVVFEEHRKWQIASDAPENYSNYTLVDASGYITVASSTQLDLNGANDADSYAYRDMGANWLAGDFIHEFDMIQTSTGNGKWNPWIVSSTLDDGEFLKKTANDGYGVELKFKNGSIECKIDEYYNGGGTKCGVTFALNTWVYARVERVGTTLTLSIFSEAARTTLLTSASVVVAGETPRYVYAANNTNKAKPADTYVGSVANLVVNDFEQSGYRLFTNNDGTTVGAALAAQDTSTSLTSTGQAFRLRMLMHATGSPFVINGSNFKLQYSERAGTCDTSFTDETYADVTSTSTMAYNNNTTPADGDNLTANGGDPVHSGHTTVIQDYEEANSFTNSVAAIPINQDGLWDFALIDNGGTASTSYCFRAVNSDNSLLKKYSVIPEIATYSPPPVVTVSSLGTQIANVGFPSTNQEIEASFVLTELIATSSVTTITITENGTVDAQNNLNNIKLYYDFDTTVPYNCVSESYTGTETQYGATDTNGFSGANGTSLFTDSVTISTTSTMCLYTVLDVLSGATNGNTLDLEISSPYQDVILGSGTAGPTGAILLASTTNIRNDYLEQLHYHIRNDDGSETGATSATGGTEDTALSNLSLSSSTRIRIGISNEGSTSTALSAFGLEYSLSTGGPWTLVPDTAGADWIMTDSVNLTNGDNTTNIAVANGGVTDENTSFIINNGSVVDTANYTATNTIASTEFIEVEFSLKATTNAASGGTYYFRAVGTGATVETYMVYPQITLLSPDLQQMHYHFRNDNGTESGATSATGGLEDTAITGLRAGTTTRLRIGVSNEGVEVAQNVAFQLEFSTSTTGSWTAVPTTAGEAWIMKDSPNLTDGNDTTNIATSTGGVTDENITFIVDNNAVKDTSNKVATSTVATTEFIEMEFAIEATTNAATSTYYFRVTNNGAPLNTYLVYPRADLIFSLTQIHSRWRNDDGGEAGASVGDGHMIYGDDQITNSLYNRTISGTTFGAEGTFALGSSVGWADIEASPIDSNRLLRGAMDIGGPAVQTGIYDNATAAWTAITTVTANTGNNAQRRFDIEFEQSTGDALVVYSDNTAGSLRFRTMLTTASDWGTEQTLIFGGGVPATVRAVRDPDTDDIMVGWEDTNFDVFTALWDGAAFGAVTTHEIDSINQPGAKDPQIFDISWEGSTSTSEAMIAWMDNLGVTNYNTWTGGTWGTAGTIPGLSFSPGTKGGTVIASTRWSDEHQKIAIISGSGFDKKLRVNVWSGSSWGSSVLLGAVGADMQSDRALPVEAVWQKTSGNLFVPYITKLVESGVRLKIYNATTNTWAADSVGPLGTTGFFNGYVRADADTNSQAITILAGERKSALGTFAYVCDAPCNTGAAVEWTEQEVDIDDGSDTSVTGDTTYFESTSATFREDEDTETVALRNELLRLRFEVNNMGTTTIASLYRLEVSEPNPTTCSAGTYSRVNTNTHWDMATSSYITDAEATFNISPGLTDEDTTFVPGVLKETSDETTSISLTATQFTELEYIVTSTASSTVGATYCFRITDAGSSSNLMYSETTYGKVTLETSFTQNYYRWYVNEDANTPTDVWPSGAVDISENTTITNLYAPTPNDVLRLRTSMLVNESTLPASAASFRLQYAQGATCLASLSWSDVGAIGSTTALWRGYNNASIVDGATLSSTTLSVSDKAETYEEENDSSSNPNAIAAGEDGEYDWVIENNSAPQNTSYCFRMVTDAGRVFQDYVNYPSLITNSKPDIPTLSSPFDNKKTASTTPWFDFVTSDDASDDLHYQIQVDDSYSFTSTAIDKNSISNFLQFENTTAPSDKAPFDSGKSVRFTPQTTLTDGTTYWWRVRAKDPSGSNEWSDWTTQQSFTVDTAVNITTWFQTTEEQFDTGTLVSLETPAADNVQLVSGQTTGTTTSTAIDFDWKETGNAWGSLIWNDTETVGDIKHHIEYLASTSVWLLIPDIALSGNAAGFDTSPINILALNTDTYNQIRIRSNFSDIGGTPILNDWSVEWGQRVNQPTKTKLFDNEQTGTTTPLFEFSTTDPQSDDVQYEISWSTTIDFTASTTKLSGVDTGFLDLTNGADASPFASGDNIRYTLQSADALTASTTYWWRVRAVDPTGSNVYSEWSTLWSYTVDQSTSVSTWFQTTAEQFDTDTLTGVYTDTTTDDALVQQVVGEYGTNTLTGNTWSTVTTNNSFNDLVVVASARHQPSADTERSVRIRNKTASGFDIKVDNSSGALAGNTIVDWMVMEAGSWTLQDGAGGTKVEAGTKNVAQVQCSKFIKMGGEKVTFNSTFNGPPAVLHSVSSNSDTTWVASHVNGGGATSKDVPTETQMGLSLNRSNANCTHNPEDIDYVAVDTVHGTNDGADFDTNIGSAVQCCNGTGYANNFTSAFAVAPSVTLVSQMGEQDGAGGYMVTHTGTAVSATTYYPSVDEGGAGNRAHGKDEAVASIAFANAAGNIVRDTLTGTIESTSMDFDDGLGPFWDKVSWTDTEAGASTLLYQVLYLTSTSSWALVPDTDLPGNSTGTTTSPIDISVLSRFTYNELKLRGSFTCTLAGDCPVLKDWKVEWAAGVKISGIAREYDQIASTTSGTVAVAVNGVIQVGKTGTIQANGAWSIADVTMFPSDIITVFVDGAIDANEAVGATIYDGLGNLTGMELYKRHLTLGSDVATTTAITSVDIQQYDFTDDEDLFFDVDPGNDLDMCATTGCSDAGLIILGNTTYQPGSGTDIITHDFENNGTFNPTSNTVRVSGSWDNNATTTMATSLVILTATSTVETVDSTGAITPAFYNITFGDTSGTASWNVLTALDVDNALSVTYGTLARGTQPINVAGTLTNGANGFWTGISTTTFDGSGTSNWSDQNTTLQNVGNVLIDGTSKAILLTGNVAAQNITIGGNDTLDAATSNYDITVYGDWTNNNTFTSRSGTVFFAATSTGKVINAGDDSFYDLTFNGAGGGWSFSTSTQTITHDFTVATGTVTMPTATTTIGGSFSSVGGTFVHNNAVVEFNGSGVGTIAASGTTFTNAFYNLTFDGPGSWTFTDLNATTSNNLLISQGAVTFPNGTLTIGGTIQDTGGSFSGNGGTVVLISSAAEILQAGGSSFGSLTTNGSGSWSFLDSNVTLVGDLTLTTGTLTLPSGILTLGGSLTNNATLVHNNGTVLFNAGATGNTIDLGTSSLYDMTFNSAAGGWTIAQPATTTNNFTLTSANDFTLGSGQILSVGGTFTNSVGGASTTWTGSTLSLINGTYSLNTKSDVGDQYGTLSIATNIDISMWNSSSTIYSVHPTGSLYSQDHSGTDGDLYIYGNYPRTSGTEYWSYATDFDGTDLGTTSPRQVSVRFDSGASAVFTNSTLSVIGSTTATTTIANQGSGTYTVAIANGTTTMNFYDFTNLGSTGISMTGTPAVTSLSDGAFTPAVAAGTALTISSTTIDANPALQIYRVDFSTTTAISSNNVTQTDGTPTSYWWFRDTTGNLDGEAFDNDTGDPGSIRWDDSSLVVTLSGVVYSDTGSTPITGGTCDGVTNVVRVVVENAATYDGVCNIADGSYSISGVVIVGNPTIDIFLNNASGGENASVVTKTITANVSDLDLYANRVIVRHEDVSPISIADMAAYDSTDDVDVRFTAATGTVNTLTTFAQTELYIWASSTFTPNGSILLTADASANVYDGSLYIANGATFTAAGTTTYTVGGIFTQGAGATFIPASSTVLMNATTTGKAVTSATGETIAFNQLTFNGVGGGWNMNADMTATADVYIPSGTLTGTGDMTLSSGSFYGNGLVSLGSGTTTIETTNTIGGTQAWTFYDLTLGNGTVIGTTTPAGNATTTVANLFTIDTGHFYDAGPSGLELSGSGVVFIENGTFLEDTGTVRYSGSAATDILATNYYNLDLNASVGTPTYTAVGIGILVANNLSVGGEAATIVTFDTNDTVLNVDGDLTIQSNGTLIGSDSASFTVTGSYDNSGVYTASGGTIIFDGSGTQTVASGASDFASVYMNGTGSYTLSEHATATAAFTLVNTASFTLASGQILAVGGTFENNVGGSATTWDNATLSLYGGGNYLLNPATTTELYDTILIGTNTDIRTWNSKATTTLTLAGGSLYSMDHSNIDGEVYIFGDYEKNSGSDVWSYAVDFDGTDLSGGSERKVDVFVRGGDSVLYSSGGALMVTGITSASTTVQNQGSGVFSLTIGNAASTTMSYYAFEDMDSDGVTFTGVPNVTGISYGSFLVANNADSAITVGGTVFDANPALTFTDNIFATTSGVTTAVNVTATGTSVSSWRFTNHMGDIDGEGFDVDPDGDPGYVVWDDSAASITISGNVYSDEGTTVSAVCDGVTNNIHLRVAGLTSYTTSCNGGSGLYSISAVTYSPGDSLIAYIDGEAVQAATVSADPISNINNMDLYEDRVIVRHEGTEPLSIVDMTLWDSSDDVDIPFTAVNGGTDTLVFPADTKLIVWNSKKFEPLGDVTLSGGGGGAAHDGTLQLFSSAIWTANGTEQHTIGGSVILDAGAVFTAANSTTTFITTGAARTIDVNGDNFYNVAFTGSGSWNITDATFDVQDVFITAGTVTLPTGTTTVSGIFDNSGGTFTHNNSLMLFDGTSSGNIISGGGSDFAEMRFTGSGAWNMTDTNATSTASITISGGTVTLPSGIFAVGGNFSNSGGTVTHNTSEIKLTSNSTTTLYANGSDLGGVHFSGTGPYTMLDNSLALTENLTISTGSVIFASGTMSIGGSFDALGGTFDNATGTILFNSSDTGETIDSGVSDFYNVNFGSASGGWTIAANATTTNNLTLSNASSFTLSSSSILTVQGVFTNTVGGAATTWTGSTLKLLSGTEYSMNTKASGGDNYETLTIGSDTDISAWNSQAVITTVAGNGSLYSKDHAAVDGSLYILGDYHISTTTEYWNYATDFDGTDLSGGSERVVTVAIAANATTTIDGGTVHITGALANETTITNQGSGVYAFRVLSGTYDAQYYAYRNLDSLGLYFAGAPSISSLHYGDFELAVSGGTLITLASSTLNANASMLITGARFATTTAITGKNVTLLGSTTNAWTFTAHTGNLDGESYDVDDATLCGSLRWTDSACLLTQQTHYRWRNDDGGAGVTDSQWFNTSWGKRKSVRIKNSDVTTYTDAVIKLIVSYDADMQADFDDLRFTDNFGTTSLSYFIGSTTNSGSAEAWVKVPSLPSSDSTLIYMYYNNALATTTSSSTTTFLVSDDFEDGSLSEYSGDTGLFTIDGTYAYGGTNGLDNTGSESSKATDGIARFDQTINQGEIVRFMQYIDTGVGSGDETCALFGVQSPVTINQNYAVCLEQFGVDRVSLVKNVQNTDSSGTVLASSTITYTTGWYEVEIDWQTTNDIDVTVSRNGVIGATISASDSTYTSGGYGFTYWFNNGGWDNYTSRPRVDTEPSVKFGGEQVNSGATWASALDTKVTSFIPGDVARLRMLVDNTGLQIVGQTYLLEYAERGGAPSCEAVLDASYASVPVQSSCGSSPVCMQSSSNVVDGEPIADLLSESDGQFVTGELTENPANTADSLTINQNSYTELEYVLTPTVNIADENICFRVTNSGTSLDTYLKIAAMQVKFDPSFGAINFNEGADIALVAGTTTTVYATSTVTDLNGYADLQIGSSTMYTTSAGAACTADNNNCYIESTNSQCSFTDCSGNSCTLSCSADFYFHADATDTDGGNQWWAFMEVEDTTGGYDFGTSPSQEVLTLRALDVNSTINYGALPTNSDTGATNASTSVENLGNDAIDVQIVGNDLSDGLSSTIPAAQQIFATSTFTYASCVTCTTLSTTSINYEVDLAKPTTTTPAITDDIFWGIAIPFGVASSLHSGTNTFFAIGD